VAPALARPGLDTGKNCRRCRIQQVGTYYPHPVVPGTPYWLRAAFLAFQEHRSVFSSVSESRSLRTRPVRVGTWYMYVGMDPSVRTRVLGASVFDWTVVSLLPMFSAAISAFDSLC
jgi:hypothetical protein